MSKPLTVVEVTPSLGIGGVETHLYRLARGLTDRGHRVVMLVQEPGADAERARASGAELVAVPFSMHGAAEASSLLSSYQPDLIHAHNYRAARFASGLARRLRVPYLMSVHGPRPWWKRALFRHWSETVIATSESDRDNISGVFGVDANRIALSFLGVDTDRFNPAVERAAFRRDIGVDEERPLIVHVSRFSHRKARPALALIDALPLVRRRVDSATLLLVGDGPELDRIKAKSAELNHRAGSDVVIVTGARTDIPDVMAAADVVVATATTALEAMAVGVPTIALGRTGYFGPVTPENFDAARAVCFADHGRLPRVARRRLVEDLVALVRGVSAARAIADAVGSIVSAEYNLDKMAVHIEGIYRRVLNTPHA